MAKLKKTNTVKIESTCEHDLVRAPAALIRLGGGPPHPPRVGLLWAQGWGAKTPRPPPPPPPPVPPAASGVPGCVRSPGPDARADPCAGRPRSRGACRFTRRAE